AYTERVLQKVSSPNVVAHGEERSTGEMLLLFTGAADLREVAAALLAELDRMMADDWSRAAPRPDYLLPQLRLALHTGFGEYDGTRISSPSLVQTLRAHVQSTAIQDMHAGDAIGVVALVTNDAYDAEFFDRHCGRDLKWHTFSHHVPDANPLIFWVRAALGSTTPVQD
ncbi:hypothetical protein ACWHA1_34595, partial [Streptomyces decoyicus]